MQFSMQPNDISPPDGCWLFWLTVSNSVVYNPMILVTEFSRKARMENTGIQSKLSVESAKTGRMMNQILDKSASRCMYEP